MSKTNKSLFCELDKENCVSYLMCAFKLNLYGKHEEIYVSGKNTKCVKGAQPNWQYFPAIFNGVSACAC